MKKVFVFFLFVFLLVHHKTNAQGFIRAQTFEGTYLRNMLIDDSDNIYSVGNFQGTVDVDPNAGVYNLTSVGVNNIAIIKQDSAGNLLWARQIKGRPWAPLIPTIYVQYLTADKAGNIYLEGQVNDSFDLDPSANDYWIGFSSNSWSFFILKLSPNGDFIWASQYRAYGNANIHVSGFLLKDESIYVTADIQGTVDIDPGPDTVNAWPINAIQTGILEKLDTAGHFHWAKQINGARYLGSIIMDTNANIFAKGDFSGTVDFDPGLGVVNMSTPVPGGSANFIEKFDSSGNYQWALNNNGGSMPYNPGLWKVDKGNNILIKGVNTSTNTMFLRQLTNNGSFTWAKQYASYSVGDFTFDSIGNIYSLGQKDSTVSIQKLTSQGIPIWAESYKATQVYNLALNHSNKLLTSGYFYGNNVDLDPTAGVSLFTTPGGFIQELCTDSYPITLTADTTYATPTNPVHLTATYFSGATYVWMKDGQIYNSNGTNTLTTTAGGNYTVNMYGLGCTSVSNLSIIIDSLNAIGDIHNLPQFFIYPNPAKDQIIVQCSQAGSLSLMDITGRIILQHTASIPLSSQILDISSLAKGVYLLRFSSNEGAVETVKVVKE